MLENLETPPGGSDAFLWCDFSELRALIHPDRCFSRGDLVSLEQRSRSLGTGFDAELRWRDIINFAGIRKLEFKADYPFSISEDEDTLTLENNGAAAHRLYIGLLISASMRHLPNTRKGEVARAFEETCFAIFSSLMPTGSEVRATWAGGGAEAPYKGHLYEKLIQVAADIRCTANIKPSDFKPNNNGDGGIDLIAWHGMDDEREGIPISFAQCGCSREEWRFKHVEASWFMHNRKLPVMHPWANYYFLPLDLREFNGDWAYKSEIGPAIIVDRLRIMRLSEQYDLHAVLPSMLFVDEAAAMAYA